ncbi:MAG: ABC transporter substrate-binding protein [Dongiaceae bacterium]
MSDLKINRRQFGISAAAISAVTTLGLHGRRAKAAVGSPLKSRMNEDIQVLDPGYMIGGSETTVQFATLPRLAIPVQDAGGTWTWAPSDYVSDISQGDDGNISFTLKPGFMWSDGYGELTAEDVKFSFERMPATDWGGRWPTLDHVEVKDKYSGVIVVKSLFAPMWLIGISSESGTILCKAAVEKLPEKRFTTELPAQCGPYTMVEWQPKEKIILKVNPDFPGTKPDFAEVHIVNIEDDKAAELAFEAGEVDITHVTPPTAKRYRESMPPDSTLIQLPGPLATWMGMNTEHEKLKDVRVRRAIQRAVDVDSIIEASYSGSSPKAFGIIPLGLLGYRPAAKYNYNPDEARALLAEAGVSGLSLELKVLNDPANTTSAQVIQANLADVGIKVDIIPLDSGPYWNLGLEEQGEDWKTLEIWIMRYRTSPDPHDMVQWFVGSQVGIWNWERWKDSEFDELFVNGQAETDIEKRAQGYLRMQEIMEDTGAYLWITHEPAFFIHKNGFKPAFDSGAEPLVERYKLT